MVTARKVVLMNSRFPAVNIMATAMEELRGLDRSLIIEFEDNGCEIVSACTMIEIVLKGFIAAPEDVQTAIMSAGATPNPKIAKAIYALVSDKTRLDKVLAEINNFDVSNMDKGYAEIDCGHWLSTEWD
jgi:hypothetical protein